MRTTWPPSRVIPCFNSPLSTACPSPAKHPQSPHELAGLLPHGGRGQASKFSAPSLQTSRTPTTTLLITVCCMPTKPLHTLSGPAPEALGNGRKTRRITGIQALTSSQFRHTLALLPSAIVTKHPSLAIPSSGALIPLLTRAP
ncbi:hypothetical protein CCHR01_02436 [Colletotrichum chrysophilum]|uniref:Uncharacterized protein n=1 Tax=Colletotrichum chrysophilum TaxID=1836956 RepID=A0AAD9ENK2_9PEZI|nr:hypothetical protein CCHR01_02436 [Colletotrichum chrysophilum]